MSHEFLVLHFGGQCPWHLWVIEQAKSAATHVGGTVEVIDVTHKPEMAARYRLFFPFMTIINETVRLPSPTSASRLIGIAREGLTAQPTVLQISGPETQAEKVAPLTVENIADTFPLCVPSTESQGCIAKRAWAYMLKDKVRKGILGFIAYDEQGKAVSAVEFLPANLIPYPLPEKDPSLAVITCIYSPPNGLGTDQAGGSDYRSQVLKHLMEYLSAHGYGKLQVIAGRRTPYPNGPVPSFIAHGFRELGEIDRVVLTEGAEELVLMEKEL
jgi:hypothetical protein